MKPIADAPTPAEGPAEATEGDAPDSGVHMPPPAPPWTPTLRQGELLAELDRRGYRLIAMVNGPAPGLRLYGPLETLPDDLKRAIAAARSDLMADLAEQWRLAADLAAHIDAADVWDDLYAAHSRLRSAWDCRALPAAVVSRLSRRLAVRSRSVPCSWNQVEVDRYLRRHGGQLKMVSRRLARASSRTHAVRRFGADGSEHRGTAQGELVGIVARQADVPRDQPEVTWYTIDELARMQRLTPDEVRAVHEAKRTFDGEVLG